MFLAKSTELDPDDPLAWLWRAGLAEEAEQALIWLNRALDLDSDHPQARRALPRVRMQAAMAVAWARDFSMARQLFHLAVDADPSSIIPWLELAGMAQSSDEARQCLEEVLRRQPDHAGARQCMEHLEAERLASSSTPTPLSIELVPELVQAHAAAAASPNNAEANRPISVELELTPEAALEFSQPTNSAVPRQSTLMVIDDNPEVRAFVHRHLESPDLRVISAKDSKEALAMLREEDSPDLILLDGIMPGIDGYELCKLLRTNRDLADVPIVLLARTDDWLPNSRQKMSAFTDKLAKPISPSSLRAIVVKHCPHLAAYEPHPCSWPELPEEALR